MKTITIDSSTVWKSLPWAQIKEKIFVIQQKLYESSKECNQKEVEKLQNYILDSSDSKIFAVQTVVNYISKYYNKRKYNFNDEDKLFIYESLLESNICCTKIQCIIEQIKQYLVYLCLKPEWEARFEPTYQININSQTQYHFLYRLSKFILISLKYKSQQIYCCNSTFQLTSNYIDLKYLIYKIQPLTSISYYLQNWLCNQYNIESLNDSLFTVKWVNNPISNLNQLIYRIMYNGIDWYNTSFFQNQDIYIFADFNQSLWIYSKNNLIILIYIQNINLINYALGIKNRTVNISDIYKYKGKFLISNYLIYFYRINSIFLLKSKNNSIIQIDKKIYQYFVREVRKVLYHQNTLYQWRSNSNLNLNNLLKKIKEKFLNFYTYYYPLTNSKNINILIILINNLIFRWIKKNKKMLLINPKNKIYAYLLSNL